MKNLKSSIILKSVSYIMIPVLLLIIIVNTASIAILVNNPDEIKQGIGYFETESFKNHYLDNITSCSDITLRENARITNLEKGQNEEIYETKTEDYTNEQTTVEVQIYKEEYLTKILQDEENYSKDNEIVINYNTIKNSAKGYDILIIKENMAYTNIEKTTKTDTIDKLKEYISKKQYHWNYTSNEITTDIESMKYEEIAYNYNVTTMQENEIEVYSCVRDKNLNQFIIGQTMYSLVSKTYENAPASIIVSGVILLLIIVYLVASIGHKKNYEGIYTDWLEKIPLEILLIISTVMLSVEGIIFVEFTNLLHQFFTTAISLLVSMGIVIYITTAILLISIIRRIKAKIFFKNTLCYKILEYLYNKAKSIKNNVLSHTSINLKIIILIVSIIVISVILLFGAINNFFFFILFVAFWIFAINRAIKYTNKIYTIREKIQSIYNGNVQKQLNEDEFEGELKQVAIELNDISGGLSNAIEEGLKSERMKTDLITNVSHDIKTPLTSIINYVDLLKKEDIQNETAREYLQILDNKSQRLKKLTEDLIEASKVSSGNIKLKIEKLNLGELLKQIRGEFEDKFNKKELEIIENIPKEEVYINADSKYMYRVMENLYTNIAKYALENSRVYVDLISNGKDDNKKAYVILKNISQDKLNISADELMQRFVRGDSSRTTTGSGLGLSIAKSLVELQNGKFEMYLDGDLFKIVIEF